MNKSQEKQEEKQEDQEDQEAERLLLDLCIHSDNETNTYANVNTIRRLI